MAGTLHENQYSIYLWLNVAQFFLLWKKSHTKFVEKIKTHILCSTPPPLPRKSCRLWVEEKKYSAAGHAKDGNMAHVHCMLDTQGCIHTIRICNIYCFSTATMLARKRLLVTLYTHCLSRCISYNTRNENLWVCVQLDKPLCG
jgi:hypothetical protein